MNYNGITSSCSKRGTFLLAAVLIGTILHAQLYYDANGNLTKDKNKGLDSIYYNQLNLIEQVDLSDGRQVRYSYDAQGNKLTKNVVDGNGNILSLIHYINGIEYDQHYTLQHLATGEGRVVPDSVAFTYHYNLKNHKGNVLVSFNESGLTQTNSYYPYGYLQPGSEWVGGVRRNKYLLTGKEQQEETSLFDFGARMLNPTLGRWHSVDPLAEKYYAISPYAYVANNPIKFIDPDGRALQAINEGADSRSGSGGNNDNI